MKKFRSVVAHLLALSMAFTMAAFPTQVSASSSDDFYAQLARLQHAQDDSAYFGEMELKIGSNVLTVDGEEIEMDVAPDAQENRTMLPIRAVAEAAGASVSYDAQSKTAVIVGACGQDIRCPIGQARITVNSETYDLDVPSYVKDGRTFLPVRAVSEALDLDVEWDQESASVHITAPYQTCRVLAWADNLEYDGLGADTVIHDGSLWVLQFSTPAQARQTTETLQARGVIAEPDLYIPPVNDETSSAASAQGSHNSWGVTDCKFDAFVERHSDSFTGKEVVAVIDTGVDASHPFLKGRVLPGRDFVDGDSDADDEHYHGTHVAATIIDCAGSAPVSILPVRVLNERGSGYQSAICAGIRYSADQGADVMNMSLGGGRGAGDVIDAAISYAIGKGTASVVAAGNDSANTSSFCPAHIDTAGNIVVSAGDSRHKKAYFTNYGSAVDVMGPGVDIKAAVPGSSYKTLSGTSMATPHVAAAAALLDLAWGKSLTPAQMEEKVRTAANGGKWDQYNGYGFLDMSKAAVPDESNPDPVPTPAPERTVKSYSYSVSSLSLKKGESAKVTVTATYTDGTTKDVTALAGLYSSDKEVATVSGGSVRAVGEGTCRISMSATPSSVTMPKPITVTVTGDTEKQPVVTEYRYSPASLKLTVGETAKVQVQAVYSDGSVRDVTTEAGLVSSAPNIAIVSDYGEVSGVLAGTARVSMSAAPAGVKVPAPVTVTVSPKPGEDDPGSDDPGEDTPAPEESYVRLYWGLSIGDTAVSSVTLSKGSTYQLDLYGETASGKTVKLTDSCMVYSADPSVVTIDSSGRLVAVGSGSTYIGYLAVPNTGLKLPGELDVTVN